MQKHMRARRSMMSGLGAAAVGVALTARPAAGQNAAGRFQAARHQQDAWLDAIAGKHRIFIDASTPRGAGEAMLYANNLYTANKAGYSLPENDIVVVACLRHFATVFAFNDAMWAKYGKPFSDRMDFLDPKTNKPPTVNVHAAQLGALLKQGVHLAVCNLTTRSVSQRLSELTGVAADDIYKELTTNTLGNAHFVAAGVVGVTRAQERGYALISIG